MQEPLDNLSSDAREIHAVLDAEADRSFRLEQIATTTGLTQGECANALRELDAATRASESFRGWSVLR